MYYSTELGAELVDHKPLALAVPKVSELWSAWQQRHLAYVSEIITDSAWQEKTMPWFSVSPGTKGGVTALGDVRGQDGQKKISSVPLCGVWIAPSRSGCYTNHHGPLVSSQLINTEAFAPVPALRHGPPQFQVLHSLRKAELVFMRHDVCSKHRTTALRIPGALGQGFKPARRGPMLCLHSQPSLCHRPIVWRELLFQNRVSGTALVEQSEPLAGSQCWFIWILGGRVWRVNTLL